jgi:hypothetical protein
MLFEATAAAPYCVRLEADDLDEYIIAYGKELGSETGGNMENDK